MAIVRWPIPTCCANPEESCDAIGGTPTSTGRMDSRPTTLVTLESASTGLMGSYSMATWFAVMGLPASSGFVITITG